MNTPAVQHATNVAVLAVPATSFWVHAPEIVTVAVGVMAFLYYLVFFAEKIIYWRKRWQVVKTTTTTHEVTEVIAAKHVEPAP